MLQALFHKKLKDSFENPHFSPSEDSFTSSVIGLMQYLPDDYFWLLLKRACGQQSSLPESIGNIHQVYFWDRWNAKGTNNSSYVEPDVWVDADKYDIIIEAKKTDLWVLQHQDQWENEIKALLNERGCDEGKPILFIALGGNESLMDSNCNIGDSSYIISTASWFNLLQATVTLKESVEYSNTTRVLNDIINAFKVHGYFNIQWLDGLASLGLRKSSSKVLAHTLAFDNHKIFRGLYRPHNPLKKCSFSVWKIKSN